MKYNIIQNADGNTSIVSEWSNINSAKQNFHNQCRILYADPDTTKAIVGLFDEQLNIVDEKKEWIDKSVPTVPVYTVLFNLHGGEGSIPSQSVEQGQKVTQPTDPIREGYTFTGWELDGYAYDFDSLAYKDMTLVATWEKE